jgi:hypothetical protein
MATTDVTLVSFFDVWEDRNHSAYYNHRVDLQVSPGSHGQLIRDAVQADKLPNGGGPPPRGTGASERALDVIETRSGGHCVYVFRLNAATTPPRSSFVTGKPFIKLPLNSVGGEDFLTSIDILDPAERRWASFACDLDAVRGSGLAQNIKSTGHGPSYAMTIPFCFNVYDDNLKASPWVVPGHSHSHVPGTWTHGGVHPPTTSFLIVPL